MSQIVSFPFEEELKKNQVLKESDIKCLKEWSEKQPHLPKITDSSLALFHHKNDYDIEATKVNIENYYTFRTHLPEFFSNRHTLSAEGLRNIFSILCITTLKESTKEGYEILFIKLIDTDADKFVFTDYVKYLLMVLDLSVYQRGIGKGYIVILDAGDICVKHAARINPFILKKYFLYLEEGMPIHLRQIHFVNVNRGMEAILNISRPLMSKRHLEMWHVHPTTKSLEKCVPIELLPNELGGKAGQLMEVHKAQMKKFEEHKNWFLEEELRSKVDETKRLGKAKTAADIFGDEVSFKKFNID